MGLESLIGRWEQYPKSRKLFEATFFVYLKSETQVVLQINTDPDSIVGTPYSVQVSLGDFRKFVFAISTGQNLMELSSKSFFTRKFRATGKYAFSEIVYFWKIPISYQTFVVGKETTTKLFEDFCTT